MCIKTNLLADGYQVVQLEIPADKNEIKFVKIIASSRAPRVTCTTCTTFEIKLIVKLTVRDIRK